MGLSVNDRVLATASMLSALLDQIGKLGIRANDPHIINLFLAVAVGGTREASMSREDFDAMVTKIWHEWTDEMGSKRS